MGTKRSERHHLVSQGYLRAWRPDGETVRVRAVILPRTEPKLIGIDHLCVKPHWLSVTGDDGERDDTLETQLGIFEGNALPLLRAFAATGFAPATGRINIAYLVTSLAIRGTTLRGDLRAEGIAAGEQYLAENPDAVQDPIRWEQEQHASGDLALLTSFELIAPHHAAWLASMHWALYRDPRGGFMTADQPVVHVLDTHTEEPRTSPTPLCQGQLDAIMVALTPWLLLVGSWRAGPDSPVELAPIGLPGWFNQRLQDQTDRHLIYPPSAAPRSSPRVRFPEVSLRRDSTRLDAAVEARDATEELDDPAGMVYVRALDGEYRLFTTMRPAAT